MGRKKTWRANRDIVLYVAALPPGAANAIHSYGKRIGKRLKAAVIFDARRPELGEKSEQDGADILIPCDFTLDSRITTAIKPYEDRILAVSCRSEQWMAHFRKLIPHLPYLRTPTESSIIWSTDKLEMRRRLMAYDPSITPKYTLVKDAGKQSLERIKKNIGFPLVVKPATLAQSLLVGICYHREELEATLRKVLRAARKQYKDRGLTDAPKILVEQFLDGNQYSIDGYVGSRGGTEFCPPVAIKTGRSIGFDDFFGYRQMTPTTLSKEAVADAEKATGQAVRALGLRNTTFHAELIRTEQGWKIIEVGARAGGFRHELYSLAYGINHAMNDVLVHIPEKRMVARRKNGYAAAMKFFAKKEGRLAKLLGTKKAQNLSSFQTITVNKKVGDMCRFAKNGGKSVFNIILFNKDRSELLGDIRRLESMVKIETKRVTKASKPKKKAKPAAKKAKKK